MLRRVEGFGGSVKTKGSVYKPRCRDKMLDLPAEPCLLKIQSLLDKMSPKTQSQAGRPAGFSIRARLNTESCRLWMSMKCRLVYLLSRANNAKLQSH